MVRRRRVPRRCAAAWHPLPAAGRGSLHRPATRPERLPPPGGSALLPRRRSLVVRHRRSGLRQRCGPRHRGPDGPAGEDRRRVGQHHRRRGRHSRLQRCRERRGPTGRGRTGHPPGRFRPGPDAYRGADPGTARGPSPRHPPSRETHRLRGPAVDRAGKNSIGQPSGISSRTPPTSPETPTTGAIPSSCMLWPTQPRGHRECRWPLQTTSSLPVARPGKPRRGSRSLHPRASR